MKKIIWLSAAILVILGFLMAFQGKNMNLKYSPAGNALKNISLNGNAFQVEMVSTADKIALGLSGRESLCADCGMLFAFTSDDYRRFWMRGMLFDLDMLWIMDNRVVYLAKNVPHEKGTEEVVAPGIMADKILELSAGTSDRLGIKVGDRIEF